MRLLRVRQPIWAASGSSFRSSAPITWTIRPELSTAQWEAGTAALEGRRNASVKAQGAYKIQTKSTIPKKMGAKKTGDMYVIPGNIIYKQRGTIWHPGENTIMGRDFTIHAAVTGFVKYYRDPFKHPDRQYIGVVFNKDDKLPYHPTAVRKRKPNMLAFERKPAAPVNPISPSGIPRWVTRQRNWLIEESDEQPTGSKETVREVTPETAEPASEWAKRKKGQSRASFARRIYQWGLYEKRAVRVLRLHKNYGYSETNVDVGRLMGTHRGKTPGTTRLASRHGVLRARAARKLKTITAEQDFWRQTKKAMAQAKSAKSAKAKKGKAQAAKKKSSS